MFRRMTATNKTNPRVNQVASPLSKITYNGANTSTKVLASLRASPIISAVYFFSIKEALFEAEIGSIFGEGLQFTTNLPGKGVF